MLLFLGLMVPALVFTLIASVLPAEIDDIPGPADYYQGALITLIILGAIIAPELLCADRRSGVISLYLVRPLSATDYVVARWGAFFSIVLALVYLPQIVLLIGLTLAAAEPLDYLRDNWLDIPRFLGAGLALALFTSTLPMAVAAFTTRRAYAAAFVIGLWVVSTAVGNALVENIGGSAARWLALIDVGSVPIFVNDIIFDKSSDEGTIGAARQLPNALLVGWYLLMTAVPGLVLWRRYRRIGE
jgi:ABC-2 type transport system permease protein